MRERRRRLMTDDGSSQSAPIRLAAETGSGVYGYSDAGRAARQMPVSQLVPLGIPAISLLVTGCLLAVAACLGLHLAAEPLAQLLGEDAAVSLRIDQSASLGHWLGSTLLGMAGAMAVFNFSLRRHRLDDYHARYRMWLSMALACMALSLLESTSLASLVRESVRLGAQRAGLRFDVVWPLTIALVATLISIRLVFEIRRCWPALVCLTLSVLSFAFTASVYHGWPIELNEASLPLWARGSWLLGYVLVLTTFILYGRRVQLDVAGAAALPAKPKRRKKSAASDADEQDAKPASRKSTLKIRTDLDPVESEPKQAAKTPVQAPAATTATHTTSTAPTTAATTAFSTAKPAARETESSDEAPSTIKASLSRAERRKLKQDRRMAS